ncbi:MAG: hypothetical protein FWF15_03700 [Oscillospiraceae bacterium]|nr:hypothetical protein [Oscillospiraceae bacterium]
MFEIIKVYKQNIDPLRFIGKKYDNANRINGTFEVKSKWSEWFQNGWFETIGNSDYIGLLRNGEGFQYWIGIFAPDNTEVPEGYDYIDFPKSELAVCWVYGKEEYVSMNEGIEIFEQCKERLEKEGIYHAHDKDDICYAFERYVRPRSITPDENGHIILDICFFIDFQY